MPRRSRPDRRLRSGELATAAVMAGVAVGLNVLTTVFPPAGPFALLGIVPFAVVARRYRPRATLAAASSGLVISTLVLGLSGALGIVEFALLGGVIGELKRRGRRIGSVFVLAAVAAPIVAGLVEAAMYLFSSLRELFLDSLGGAFVGAGRLLRKIGVPRADQIGQLGHHLRNDWPIWVPVAVMVIVAVSLLVGWALISAVLDRLEWVSQPVLAGLVESSDAPPAPVPVALADVSVEYGEIKALEHVGLSIRAGEFIAITGDNGSGKSTLARLLAGAAPTTGAVIRDGTVGLGRRGGTALISQRPDAQVLGLRVADDVVWGLEDHAEVDVEALLATVGLAGLGDQDTATLSGGQLQRLAVAAALAREPRLLISDESTAMVDPAGRTQLMGLFQRLVRERGMTIVHITHNLGEAAAADRLIRLERGRVVTDPEWPVASARPMRPPTAVPSADARLVLTDVSHTYARGTLWERQALERVNLTIDAGEGVLVVGGNGSGKSTLAWIIAGLLRPTGGAAVVAGRPTHKQRGTVGLAFQHARLLLQRPTVGADIADAAGWTRGEAGRRVSDALALVGLEPDVATRSIEQLSGGQQRRVVLAGLLARRPRVLVLDEPFAGVDAPTRAGLVDLLAEMRMTLGLTLIIVTHDPEPLSELCPRVVHLAGGRVLPSEAVLV